MPPTTFFNASMIDWSICLGSPSGPSKPPVPWPRAVMLITFAIALIGAIVMSLPPAETPVRAMPRAVPAASLGDVPSSPAPAEGEKA